MLSLGTVHLQGVINCLLNGNVTIATIPRVPVRPTHSRHNSYTDMDMMSAAVHGPAPGTPGSAPSTPFSAGLSTIPSQQVSDAIKVSSMLVQKLAIVAMH